ncbi:unnamed protein product [Brachionus calyciflorus]|uniref:Ubiquitin conjugation factor E4 A n=1 Tax=Brachionus calyciflorus TaxID=104777 RepID=A0A813U2E8_9BILA|nr:unnamed protein product [Brachionus calyciflorus]
MDTSNPFAALMQTAQSPKQIAKNDTELSKLLEIIFQITLDSNLNNHPIEPGFIFMGDSDNSSELLTPENLDDVLLQRIMLTDATELKNRIRPRDKPLNQSSNQFIYLYNCYLRLNKMRAKFSDLNANDLFESFSNLIINMCRTLINIFEGEKDDLSEKFLKFISRFFNETNSKSLLEQFYENFIKLFDTNDEFFQLEDDRSILEDPLELKFLTNIFVFLNQSLNIQDFDLYSNKFVESLDFLRFLTKPRLMKYLFVSSSFLSDDLKAQNKGRLWQTTTLIGKLLTPNVLPLEHFKSQSMFSEPQHQFRYFLNPTGITRQDVDIAEKNMHQSQSLINRELNSFFYEHLIRSSNLKTRNLWLKWVSKCIQDNKNKSQEWSNLNQNPLNMFLNQNMYASEGFFLNILEIFLIYSEPFLADKFDQTNKLFKINYNYPNAEIKQKNLSLLDSETKLIPNSSQGSSVENSNFNFITQCFYYTHYLIRLSYLSLYQKLIKLKNELAKWQQTYQDLAHSNDPQLARVKTMFENMTCEFLNLQSVMTEEGLVKKLSKFLFNTSLWLSFMTIKQETLSITPLSHKNFSDNSNLKFLSHTPEFILTNIVEFVTFINGFKETLLPDVFLDRLSQNDKEFLDWYLYLILTFMGRPDRVFNPHIRAQIAESIECLLPRKNEKMLSFQNYVSDRIFIRHECSYLITESLLNVFVSIEMTGQSVQFEQKFNYRRPMYELIEFLWNLGKNTESKLNRKHRDEFNKLANQALENIDSSEQPLFLKFLNYLINDANYLLVEGLMYLEKIKISQDKLEIDRMEKNLTSQQRAELESGLKHMIMLAKFHNFMSLKTIETIRMLTMEIKDIFCHDVLCDRVATMLNDFLLHLVGKKKRKQLKVKNLDEVKFKPKEIVSIICDIYLNLSENRNFCEAVCRDGRSYSTDLFESAIEVLEQIGRDVLWIEDFKKFSRKVEDISEQIKMDEANFEDAPEEYLDPIMSSLMEDPVLLPSSKKIVDRSTISRHLLSDQTDPFNRSPLTLQEVIPASDLKKEIEEWKKSKLRK